MTPPKKAIKRKGKFFVYIIKDKNGHYYTGYTNNLERRIKLHNAGKGAKCLRGRGPVELVWLKEFKSRKSAMSEEAKIKNRKREEKEELVEKYVKQ